MLFKKNKNKISWKKYKEELSKEKQNMFFNESQKNLHTMTVKESDFKDCLSSKEYATLSKSLEIFDQTNPDYLNYEKELKLGESND